jgi:hypothetical protein
MTVMIWIGDPLKPWKSTEDVTMVDEVKKT